MTRVGFIMRAHPRDEAECLVSGAVKNPFRLLRYLRKHVAVAGVLVEDHNDRFWTQGYPVRGRRIRWLRLYPRTLAWNLTTLPDVIRLFRSADIIQCHHPHLGLGAALARRVGFRSKRLIVKAHGTATPELNANRYGGLRGSVLRINARLHLWHDRFVLQSADLCLVSSDFQLAEMADLYGVEPSRLRRAYNGVDPQFIGCEAGSKEPSSSGPRLLFVGRVVPKKGFDHLFALFERVRIAHPSATLTLVLGKRRAIEHEPTHRWILQEMDRLPGATALYDLDEPALYHRMASADIGIVPSRGYESIPTVVIEMGAMGLPVFASWRWGIPEVLPPEFGLSGQIDEDAERLIQFIDEELDRWDRHSAAARFTSFHYPQLVTGYLQIYEEIQRAKG